MPFTGSPTTSSARACRAHGTVPPAGRLVTYFANSGYNHPDHLKAHDVTIAALDACAIPSKLYLIVLDVRRTAGGCARSPRNTASSCRRSCSRNRRHLRRRRASRSPRRRRGPSASTTRSSPRTSTAARTRHRSAAVLAAHASQLEGTFFLKFPDEAFAKAFGAESFIRGATPPVRRSRRTTSSPGCGRSRRVTRRPVPR